ncbi:MAG: glycosyltransferase family 4 protein, partial [Planctomycetota bacterium]
MPGPPDHPRLLIMSQVYVPDAASVGQHLHDVAVAMVERGWHVDVLTAAHGYADPGVRYPAREQRDGVNIRRLPWSSFGKSSLLVRLVAGALFMLQAVLRAAFMPRLDVVLVTTSPPMGGAAGVMLRILRRAPFCFWAMDLNPDQYVALGHATPGSIPVRVFDLLNSAVLRNAGAVVALDRFMAARLDAKLDTPATLASRMCVFPPWSHVDDLREPLPHADNPFREQHGVSDRFVLMYSGNVSPSHPLDTVLHALSRVQRDEPRLLFVVISSGPTVDRLRDQAVALGVDIRVMPYQPIEQLRYSLSAADVHLVAMGDRMVGVVHPCKVYGAMSVGRPMLFVGPVESHIGDLVGGQSLGWQVRHGDVDAA